MPVLDLLIYPKPQLTAVAEPIAAPFSDYRKLAQAMLDLMHNAKGIGLAANQVGLLKRIFVMSIADNNSKAADSDEKSSPEEFICINPQIKESSQPIDSEEGCLSLPDLTLTIKRYAEIEASYYNLAGQLIDRKLSGLAAICFQHELDHLDGKLIWDRLNPLSRNIAKKRFLKEQSLKEQNANNYQD